MSATIGSSDIPQDVSALLTHATKQITVGADDYSVATDFRSGYCRRVYCNAAGTVALQRDGDSAAVTYVVAAGQYIDGLFSLVGGTTNYSTATTGLVLNLEV